MKRTTPLELVVATKNKKKLEEIRHILKGLRLKITSLADYPAHPRIIENGKTFKENAVIKAAKISAYTGKLTLGEDSGLCVEAIGGLPGIYSARFSGGSKDDLRNNRKLLRLLGDIPLAKRKASYFCAAALVDKNGLVGVVEGECKGLIAFVPAGEFGFGYDPLFIIPKYKKTFAQLGPGIKHKMSHRFRALQKTRKLILKVLKS